MSKHEVSKANSFHCLSATKRDQKTSKLITIQAIFPKNSKEKILTTKATEAIVFEKLPLLSFLFDSKSKGTLKDPKDQLCYDPEHTKADKAARPKSTGKIVYIYDLIDSKFEHRRTGYDKIAKWNLSTLWTLMDCLVRFFDGKPLQADSKMGRAEKHWNAELESIQLLAIYLGNTDLMNEAVRTALISYMRHTSATGLTLSGSGLDEAKQTVKQPSKQITAPKMGEAKKSVVVELTENNVIASEELKESIQSAPKRRRLNKNQYISIVKQLQAETEQHHTSQQLKKQPQTAVQKLDKRSQSSITQKTFNAKAQPIPTLENLPSIPADAYIRLNKTYPRFLHVDVKKVSRGSGLIGQLLQDLISGAFATGGMAKVVGKHRHGKPTLLWDEVLKCFRTPGNMVDKMLSWSEDDRWAPLMMFVERCQVDPSLWQKWDKQDLKLARYFDLFVKARVCASKT